MKKTKSLEKEISEILTKQLPVFYDKQVAIKRISPKIVEVVLGMLGEDIGPRVSTGGESLTMNTYDVVINQTKQEIRQKIRGEK